MSSRELASEIVLVSEPVEMSSPVMPAPMMTMSTLSSGSGSSRPWFQSEVKPLFCERERMGTGELGLRSDGPRVVRALVDWLELDSQ